MATQAEVRELIAHIRRTGYKVTKSGTKHHKVLKPNGAVLVDAHGPIIISATPSEARWREMTVKRLMAAGVFAHDPYKKESAEAAAKKPSATKEGGGKKRPFEDPEVLAKAREKANKVMAEKSAEFRRRTIAVRGRIEPVVAKLGGWNQARGMAASGVTITQFADVLFYWVQIEQFAGWPRDSLGRPLKAEGAKSAVASLRTPLETIGAKWLPTFEAFADYLNAGSAIPDPGLGADRYRELLRGVKGIVTTQHGEAAKPTQPIRPVETDMEATVREVRGEPPAPTTQSPVAPEVPVYERVGPMYEPDMHVDPPLLAIETMYELLRNRPVSPDKDDTVALVARIADLELNSPDRQKGRKT